MTSPTPASNPNAASSEPSSLSRWSAEAVDASCRWPVLLLLGGAALWLVIGSVFGVVSAIKAHAPGFIADCPYLTYGRVRPAAYNAFVFGFILQAGLAMTLWIVARLGRSLLPGGSAIIISTALWNAGVLVGVSGILAGASTGHEGLELPGFSTPLLFCAYCIIAAWAVVAIHLRQDRQFYISQSLLLVALFWFPWIFSTAQVLLVFHPSRGVLQAIYGQWFNRNFFELCVGAMGLAGIFYLLPKLRNRPLASHPAANCGFWLLVLFAGWGGGRIGLPIPNWITGLSVVSQVLLLVPVLAFAACWIQTKAQSKVSNPDPATPFVLVAAVSYVLAYLLETLSVLPGVGQLTAFTFFPQAVLVLKLHGFLGMIVTGAAYHMLPRLTGSTLPMPGLIRAHFWLAALGTALSVVALAVGGVIQGNAINQSQSDFLAIVRGTIPFLGMATLGATLLLGSYLAFVVNLIGIVKTVCPVCACIENFRMARATTVKGGARA